MKLMKNRLLWLVLLIGCLVGCKQDEEITVALQNDVNEFVWLAMNGYYYWVADVEDLSVEKYPTYNDLYTFLNNYNQPENLFDDLLIDGDRFSWIVNDFEALEQSFQGISKSFGYDLGIVRVSEGSDNLLAYIRYIVPGGPAESAELARGDIFTQVNGETLNVDNYISLLFESENITLGFAEITDNTISLTGQEVTLTAVQITENPIFLSDVLEVGGVKVGYMVYNQFVSNSEYHQEMNNIFGQFKSEGINDLVLDLRYNQGGSVNTATILASLIYGAGSSNTTFTVTKYNQRLGEAFARVGIDPNDYFTNTIPETSINLNRLSLNRVFILTSGSTASASELIISGLDPYMDVTLIGTKTVGKNLGSSTLYHSPNFRKTPDNSSVDHTESKYAIQPIISRFTNIEDVDYGQGFVPNIEVNEVDHLGNLLPLGDPAEPLLAEALAIITGAARLERAPDSGRESIEIKSKDNLILIDNQEILDIVRSQILTSTQ